MPREPESWPVFDAQPTDKEKIAEKNRMFFIIVRLLHFIEDKERIIGLELILIETDLNKKTPPTELVGWNKFPTLVGL